MHFCEGIIDKNQGNILQCHGENTPKCHDAEGMTALMGRGGRERGRERKDKDRKPSSIHLDVEVMVLRSQRVMRNDNQKAQQQLWLDSQDGYSK
ncbi:hypothetical protein E2C01_022171 [Portunus trituberculatus]|uniref:Uncharacterized protein n=1 Tax=Portunus trituberculatus TaxID=210409 RepID=A0A5B7E6J4_PORTR|nr:hypothetical protein [Portunus trituberculatus]